MTRILQKIIGAAACAGWLLSFQTAAQAQVTIGVPYPETGPILDLAVDFRASVVLAQTQVNAQGGVLGQSLDLVFADTGCDPDKGFAAVKTLVEEHKVPALIGPICSGATLRQARSVSIPAGVVTLSGASASPLITTLRDEDLVFRTAVSDTFVGREMAKYVFAQGITEIAVSSASDIYNSSVARVFTEAYTGLGGKIVANQAHEADNPSYMREASALAGRSNALALFAYYGSSGTQFLQDAFSTGKFEQVFAANGMLAQETIDAVGADALSSTLIFSAASTDDRVGYKKWAELAQAADIPPDGTLNANVYDSAFMMALAIEAAGSAQSADIAAGLRLISGPEGETIYPGEYAKAVAILKSGGQVNYEGASGPVDFDENGDITGFVSLNRVVDNAWAGEVLR